MKKRGIEILFAVVLIFGGIMGTIKGLFPNMYWLNFRYLLTRTATYDVSVMPLYVQIYGLVMGVLEIAAAIFIFINSSKLKKYVIAILIINAIGCVAAIFSGDLIAIISLLIRIIVIYILVSWNTKKPS